MIDRCSKLTKATPTTHTTVNTVATILIIDWVEYSGIRFKVLIDNGPQFRLKFYPAIYEELGVKLLATTEYQLEANGKVNDFNDTNVSRPHYYIAEHQQNWDSYLLPSTYVYITQGHRETTLLQFSLVLSRQSPGRTTSIASTMSPDVEHVDSVTVPQICLIGRVAELKQMIGTNLWQALKQYRGVNDKKVRFDLTLAPGDCVFVKRPLPTTSAAEWLTTAAEWLIHVAEWLMTTTEWLTTAAEWLTTATEWLATER